MSNDLGPVLSAVTDYADARVAAVRDEADAALAALSAEFEAYKATHPDAPPPAPDTTPGPLLGMSAPATLWAQRRDQVQATGGKLQARRVFLTALSSSLALVAEAHAENLLPVVSFKPGNWADVASGAQDSALRNLAQRLEALSKPVVVCLHHEPDQKSTPPDVGEGGTAAEFADMQARAVSILKTAPNVKVAVIMNGWWWDDRGGLTDAQINVWLPASLRKVLDVVAADDYSPLSSGSPSVTKTRNRVEWAKRMGDVKATGIGEFNGFTPSDIADVVNYAKTEPLFRGGFLLIWNSTGQTYLPLNETGLLDDFQALLKGWLNP